MKNQHSYTYAVLRYVHDVTSGEFVNVGVALYAPQARYLGALCRTIYGRLSQSIPRSKCRTLQPGLSIRTITSSHRRRPVSSRTKNAPRSGTVT